MQILNKAAHAAHITQIHAGNVTPYSRFPVWETEFWEVIFNSAKNPSDAEDVLVELRYIEAEPCIDNERIWRNVNAAKNMAKLTLMKVRSEKVPALSA